MMEILLYIFSGIIQGLLEWIPVSSKSNLVIFLMHFGNFSLSSAFNIAIMLHIGTVIAAIVYFRKDIIELLKPQVIKSLFSRSPSHDFYRNKSRYLKFLIVVLFFTFLIMGPLYLLFRTSLDQLNLSVILLAIGLLLIAVGYFQYRSRKTREREVNFSNKNATVLGVLQGLTIIPGISRSGMTTSTLLFEGFNAEDAFKISFLLSIPTVIIGEVGLAIINGFVLSGNILLGILISGFIGYFMIDVIIRLAKKVDFSYFCMGLGFIYLLIYLLSIIFNFVL